MSSIVLEPGVKDMILDDCRDFLSSEDWFVMLLSLWFILILTLA